jgi:hypothetical protein
LNYLPNTPNYKSAPAAFVALYSYFLLSGLVVSAFFVSLFLEVVAALLLLFPELLLLSEELAEEDEDFLSVSTLVFILRDAEFDAALLISSPVDLRVPFALVPVPVFVFAFVLLLLSDDFEDWSALLSVPAEDLFSFTLAGFSDLLEVPDTDELSDALLLTDGFAFTKSSSPLLLISGREYVLL